LTDEIVKTVEKYFGEKIKTSNDPSFNDIPLKNWDILAERYKNHILAINAELGNGEIYSLSDGVCMLKEAARQIKQRYADK
jgi:hypothetical protein